MPRITMLTLPCSYTVVLCKGRIVGETRFNVCNPWSTESTAQVYNLGFLD